MLPCSIAAPGGLPLRSGAALHRLQLVSHLLGKEEQKDWPKSQLKHLLNLSMPIPNLIPPLPILLRHRGEVRAQVEDGPGPLGHDASGNVLVGAALARVSSMYVQYIAEVTITTAVTAASLLVTSEVTTDIAPVPIAIYRTSTQFLIF